MIYTSYFANIKNLPQDLKIVSIARSTPTYVECEKCAELFPEWKIINLVKSENSRTAKAKYVKEYEKQLAKLDVKEFAKKLQNCVLLCYEKPSDFCHRHIVSNWFRRNGFECQEFLKKD